MHEVGEMYFVFDFTYNFFFKLTPQDNVGHSFNVETRDFATTQSQFSFYPAKPTSDN